MSGAFYAAARQVVGPVVKPLGFRGRGRFYHRIVGTVVQQFCLLWLNHNFTIRFHISSVYGDNDRYIEGNEVTRLIPGSGDLWLGQRMVPCEPRQLTLQGPAAGLPPRYQDCAAVCADVLTGCLLPWFEKASDPRSAYQMATEAKLFLTPHQEPESHECLGFLLDMKQWETCAAILEFYLTHSHLYNPKWWSAKAQEFQQLYDALVRMDTAYLDQYMAGKKAETCRVFR